MKNIQAKLQTFAGAMMVPIILLVLVGFFVGIGSAFTNYILPEGNILYNLFTMISNLGFFFMNNLTAVLCSGESHSHWPRKKNAGAAFAGMIMYFCFMRGIERLGSIGRLDSRNDNRRSIDGKRLYRAGCDEL